MTTDNDTALERLPSAQLHPLVQVAMSQGSLDPATLREMLELQRDWQAGEAKRAYTAAIVGLKRDLPAVLKRDQLVSYKNVAYRHTSLAQAMDAVTEPLQRHGFSISWVPSTDRGEVTVTCRLTHADGHSEEASLSSPADSSGNKSAAQGVASTITLLSRYTLLALLGIATADHVEVDNENTIDATRNLKAVASLRKVGITIEQAEEAVGASVSEWTPAHLEALRELHHKAKNGEPEPTKPDVVDAEIVEPVTADLDALFDKAEALDLTPEEQDLFTEASLASSDQNYEAAAEKLTQIIDGHEGQNDLRL